MSISSRCSVAWRPTRCSSARYRRRDSSVDSPWSVTLLIDPHTHTHTYLLTYSHTHSPIHPPTHFSPHTRGHTASLTHASPHTRHQVQKQRVTFSVKSRKKYNSVRLFAGMSHKFGPCLLIHSAASIHTPPHTHLGHTLPPHAWTHTHARSPARILPPLSTHHQSRHKHTCTLPPRHSHTQRCLGTCRLLSDSLMQTAR